MGDSSVNPHPKDCAMSNLLSAESTAARLGISTRTLARLKARGAIPYVAISPRHHVFREADIVAFLESNLILA